jgi:predicted PurR-regulated permease PerM
VASAQSGKGWICHLATKYHVQQWVAQNAPKLVTYAQGLSKPALSIGKGAFSLLIELFTIFVLVLILLLEGPRLRRGLLGLLSPAHAAEVSQVASEVNRSVVGYMLGNILTSVIAGVVVFVTLFTLNVPFPQLWLWVALVDFLPMIGGALAGIPTVLFALAAEGLTAGIVTGVVFLIYTQFENHVLNPVIMSKTVRISPLLVLISVLVGASIGSWVGGLFGGFVAALLSIPAAGALQVVVREVWRLTGPPLRGSPRRNWRHQASSASRGRSQRRIGGRGVGGEESPRRASPPPGVMTAPAKHPSLPASPGKYESRSVPPSHHAL